MTQQTKLYEAAKKARTRLGQLKVRTTGTKTVILDIDDYQVVMDVYSYLDQIISAYEQEQPEAIARDKTIIEIWKEWCEKDISWTDAALGAMRDFTSQQTSAKDKEITDLSGELHATDKLNQELQDEIAELKEAISELIQVKDWKDKYGKDEHYLKAMPIAWENVRKLIQK